MKSQYLGSSTGLTVLYDNPANPAKGMVARVTDKFNSGIQVGDSRLATLADSTAETITGSGELVVNGTFDVDTSGWTPTNATLSVVGGAMRVTATGASPYGLCSVPTVVGKTYVLTVNLVTPTVGKNITIWVGSQGFQIGAAAGVGSVTFIASSTTSAFSVNGSVAFISGDFFDVDNISVKLATPDRSVKNNGLIINGTLTKSAVASGAGLVGYSGFSAANYLEQPYTSAMDFGTGEWDVGAWVNVPVANSIPATIAASAGGLGAELCPALTAENWGIFGADATHIATFSSGTFRYQASTTSPQLSIGATSLGGLVPAGTYLVTAVCSAWVSGGVKIFENAASVGTLAFGGAGTFSSYITVPANSGMSVTRTTADVDLTLSSISLKKVIGVLPVLNRAAATGPSLNLSVEASGKLMATAYDGTTTRTVIAPATSSTGTWQLASASYRTDGSLALTIGGTEVARTTGTPLLTLNNSAAVLTVGNNRAHDAPFPGSISLLTVSATAPSVDQQAFIYRTELPLFQPNAQCCLAGTSTAVTALAYDDATDLLHVGTSWGRSGFKDLLRVDSEATTTGSLTSLSAQGGTIITGGTSAKVYQPALLLRDELKRREEARRALGKTPVFFDFDVASFTSPTTNGSAALTASSIVGTPYVGMGITGTGIPAGATIIAISGTSYTMSANATVTNAGAVALAQSSFTLQQGYTAKAVYSAEALKREGATKTYTRATDGFRETINFATSPGSAVWVSIMAIRSN